MPFQFIIGVSVPLFVKASHAERLVIGSFSTWSQAFLMMFTYIFVISDPIHHYYHYQ